MEKSADAFRTISEVADDLSLPQHVLRFWETRFPQIRPLKRAGGRRYYRPADVSLLKTIRQLLYDDGYTIKGVQRLLKEQGVKGLSGGVTPAELDWLEMTDMDVDPVGLAPPPESGAAADLAGAQRQQDSPTAALRGRRDIMAEALEAIDECKRILDAVLGPPR